ncbi:MAG: PKD domain-containing protein, partial [Crocinitomicaceae bacterium]
QFENNSYGGSAYSWDFGVLGTNSDVSSAFAPVFTYPQPGTYEARLIVNQGQPCTDTAYMSITINNPFSITWTSQDSLCILNHSFDFVGNLSNPSANFSWVFDTDAQVGDLSSLFINDVTFTQPGFHTVTINGDDGDCQTSFTDSIFIFDLPVSNFNAPVNEQCLGLTIPFENTSQNAISYLWDFGENNDPTDQSAEFEPTHFYNNPGNFSVQLIASSSPSCSDTSEVQITVLDPLIMSISHDDSLCITDGLFDFESMVSGPPNYTLEWVFGADANPNSATTPNVENVQYSDFGFQPVMLIGRYDVCADTVFSVVRVFGEPTINFIYVNSLQCAPSTAVFVNQSFSDGPATYSWVFGDGGTAQTFSPSHVYTDVGSYSVGLTMITSTGCIDTLYLLQQDLVVVHPSPVAGFSVSPQLTDICNAEISFTDQSQDGNQYLYLFDNGFGSTQANFTHTYTNTGSDYPLQIVTNQYGCSDSARNTVMIEPFAIYVPNTFVPDGNEVNDIFIPRTDFETNGWQFSVYNKWGERVFYSEETEIGWDGKYQGSICQDDTYIWTLKYRGCDSPYEWKLLQGFVNLLK